MEPARRPPLLLIYAVTLTGIMANSLVTTAIPDILADFGVPDSRAGVLVAAGSLPGIVVAPIIGLLADRLGRRAVLLPCLMVFGAAGALAMLAPSFPVLLVARLLQGLGSAGLINLAVVLIGDHWTGVERTRLVGRNAAVLTVGLAVLPVVSGGLTELGSWRYALAPYLLSLVMALVAWRTLDGIAPASPPAISDQLRQASRVVRQPIIVSTMAAGLVTFVIIFGLFITTVPLHLEAEFGLSAGWRGMVLAVPALGASVVAFNLGRVRHRLGLRPTLMVSAALFALAFVAMGLSPVLGLLVAGAVVYGLAEGALVPTLQDVAVSAAPDSQRGAVVAVWVGAARAGQTVGPLLAGAMFVVTGTATVLVLGAALGLALLTLFALGPIRTGPADAAA